MVTATKVPTATTIPIVLTTNSPRADEIDFLRYIVRGIPSGLYLESLLSVKVFDWFEHQAKCDFSTDLFAELETTEKQRIEANRLLNEAVNEGNTTAASHVAKIEAQKALIDRQGPEIERLGQQIGNLQKRQEELVKERDAAEAIVEAVKAITGRAWFEKQTISPDRLREAIREATLDAERER
jgi:hypothetical protein